MSGMVYYVGGYWRRKPEPKKRQRSHEYRVIHSRLFDEVTAIMKADRELEEILALSIDYELDVAGLSNAP